MRDAQNICVPDVKDGCKTAYCAQFLVPSQLLMPPSHFGVGHVLLRLPADGDSYTGLEANGEHLTRSGSRTGQAFKPWAALMQAAAKQGKKASQAARMQAVMDRIDAADFEKSLAQLAESLDAKQAALPNKVAHAAPPLLLQHESQPRPSPLPDRGRTQPRSSTKRRPPRRRRPLRPTRPARRPSRAIRLLGRSARNQPAAAPPVARSLKVSPWPRNSHPPPVVAPQQSRASEPLPPVPLPGRPPRMTPLRAPTMTSGASAG